MNKIRVVAIALISLVAAALYALPAIQASGPGTSPKNVTFNKEVAPIFFKSCAECHRPGEAAPFSLLTYEQARPWAKAIKERVVTRSMPPWHLDKTVGIQQFQNDASLSDEQISKIVRWVDGGAPVGDVKDMPAPKQWPDDGGWKLPQTPFLDSIRDQCSLEHLNLT